ncbi:36077_t:CDS:2, partial [Racocetra persica]
MEDAHTTELKLLGKKDIVILAYSTATVVNFLINSSHFISQNVAKYSAKNLHICIAEFETDIETAIKNSFLRTDDNMKNDRSLKDDPSKCIAVIAILTPDSEIYVGNVGDSCAVLSENSKAIPMLEDHKPTNKDETKQITEAANLVLSRTLGDFEFKKNPSLGADKQIVIAYSDVKKHKIKIESTEFLVLACDGIWNCFKLQVVISFIRKNIAEHKDLKKAYEDLIEQYLSKTSEVSIGTDNIT